MNRYVNHSGVAQLEQEWEMQEAAHYAQFEMEQEAGEYFFKRALPGIRKVAKAAAPVAKQLAPIAAKTLIANTSSPLATHLLKALLQAGEQSATAMEAEFFSTNDAEVSNTEAAHEAALTEVLAAEASHSGSESEAEAFLGAAIPSIVKSMGGRGVLRSVMPTLVLANARLVRLLHQRGAVGRRLLRLVPMILRRTIASLRAAHQTGRPITADLALQLMAAHAARVLSRSPVVTNGIIRNALIQKRTTR